MYVFFSKKICTIFWLWLIKTKNHSLNDFFIIINNKLNIIFFYKNKKNLLLIYLNSWFEFGWNSQLIRIGRISVISVSIYFSRSLESK